MHGVTSAFVLTFFLSFVQLCAFSAAVVQISVRLSVSAVIFLPHAFAVFEYKSIFDI